jgi:rRNA pseudouridine-1189 N-methylase Emg1 (Nep1/Mra1 family)
VLEEKGKIKKLQNDLDELDDKEQINIGITGMPGEEDNEETHDDLGNQQMQVKQEEIKKQKEKLMYLQL